MKLQYIVSRRTDGCNPFKVFEDLKNHDKEQLSKQLKRLPYDEFLQTSYWFSVASVAKANAGMRCQVCNQTQGIQVHHRTYDTHGYEHINMYDLTVLCDRCHGMFHGHATAPPPKMKKHREPRFIPRAGAKLEIPDGDSITLTHVLIDQCRANGSFTNATLRAFGLKKPLRKGWVFRLVGTAVKREQYLETYQGRCYYGTGPLESAKERFCGNCKAEIDEHTTSCEACGATDFET